MDWWLLDWLEAVNAPGGRRLGVSMYMVRES